MKKAETDDIVTYLLPDLKTVGIEVDQIRVDVSTGKTGRRRGDVWISREVKSDRQAFEREIVALIEAKHRNASVSSAEWRDAMAHGREKARNQGLAFYVVSNCNSTYRFYSAYDDSEILLDGHILSKLVGIDVLAKIGQSVTPTSSYVVDKAPVTRVPVSEREFRSTLSQLADIYRSAGLKKGDERIDPTIGLVVLKYIGEKEAELRTLPRQVTPLWPNLRDAIAADKDLAFELKSMQELLWDDKSPYRNNAYKDFRDLVHLPEKLKGSHYRRIYELLDPVTLHGASFDLFGCIYEQFASQQTKQDFGEYYTRRHITGAIAQLLLRDEKRQTNLKICDPACGTGGFLTEAYKAVRENLARAGRLNDKTETWLRSDVFWGFDNEEKSVARTKLNMFLVGDGHMHVYEQESLSKWPSADWDRGLFQYVLTNPPMGTYDGAADISSFQFTNERRMELMFTERVVMATGRGGEIAIVLNDGALEAPSRKGFREKLLEYCDVRAIVSLTRFAFAPYTREKTYVLFLRRKQSADEGHRQSQPIWHYIVDYDGFANSDKRYRTKYHDDLPELFDLFPGAMSLLDIFSTDRKRFDRERSRYERPVHEQEVIEGLTGMKCELVDIADVIASGTFNLLSETYLRPRPRLEITLEDFETRVSDLSGRFASLVQSVGVAQAG